MRSRTARLAIGAIAWIAIGAAAFFLVRSDQHLSGSRAAVRAFDLRAREAVDALADLRVAQQAYVADGQGGAFWMPKVGATGEAVNQAIASLSQSARSTGAESALAEATASVTEFGNIDKHARDYLKGGQHLMASDIIFTEGGETVATAARQVERARVAERLEHDAAEARLQSQQAIALGIAAGLVAIVVLVLGWLGGTERPIVPELDRPATPQTSAFAHGQTPVPATAQAATPFQLAPRALSPVLKAVADLCTDFGRVRDQDDLQALVGRAAEMMDASGLVVWLGNTFGADLKPVLAHGYAPPALARMPNVARSNDNAAAAAYRTSQLQIVLERPGSASGAVVAPILSTQGCIGALSAEVRNGGEASEVVQALAALFAAQLANVLGGLPASEVADRRAAANS